MNPFKTLFDWATIPTLTPKVNERDWLLWGSISLLVAYGMIVFFSTSLYLSDQVTGNPYFLALKQFSLMWIGLLVFWLIACLPVQFWDKIRIPLMALSLLLLIIVLIIANPIKGSKRWLDLGFFHLQVTEVVKFVYIIYLAGYINKFKDTIQTKLLDFMVLSLPTGLVCFLLVLQPDNGTIAEIIFFFLGMTFLAGTHLLSMIILLLPVLVMLSLAIQLSPHGIERILAFIDPWDDPFGSDYNLVQSLLAIGRGDWIGVGLGESIHKLGYIPEVQNDFIVSILFEELGYIGFLLLLVLFAILLYRLFKLGCDALERQHTFASMVVFGVMLWLFFQLFLNIGGTINLTPIKGLVLPFFSSGGSFTLIFFGTLGIVFRIEKEVRLMGNDK